MEARTWPGTRCDAALPPARWRAAGALLVLGLLAGCAGHPGTSGSGVDTVEIVLYPASGGETLSSIADDFYGHREAASYLAEVNDVSEDTVLEPGALVRVPVGEEDVTRHKRRTEAKILYNRGTGFAERGDLQKAEEEFRLALTADPEFFDAGYNLGVVLLMMGDTSRAAAALERATALRPGDPDALFALGKAYFDDGLIEDALTAFERVLEIDPGFEDAHYSRAIAELRLGRRGEAIVHLDSYLRRFPDGVWADRARAKLEELARGAGAEDWPHRRRVRAGTTLD